MITIKELKKEHHALWIQKNHFFYTARQIFLAGGGITLVLGIASIILFLSCNDILFFETAILYLLISFIIGIAAVVYYQKEARDWKRYKRQNRHRIISK